MMNKGLLRLSLITTVCLIIFSVSSKTHGQNFSAGLKAGGAYSLNDNGSEIFANGERYSAESKFGYLGGAFLELNFGKWLIRPEVMINRSTGEFVFPNTRSKYILDKLSIPFLLGYNIYGPVDIFVGPAYQLILDKSLENTGAPIKQNYNNFAIQSGVKMKFNRWEIDLRYDFTLLSEYFQRVDIKNVANAAYFDEGRLNQVMLSLSYKLLGSDIAPGRRGKSCYF
jgi:hypothetical protein